MAEKKKRAGCAPKKGAKKSLKGGAKLEETKLMVDPKLKSSLDTPKI